MCTLVGKHLDGDNFKVWSNQRQCTSAVSMAIQPEAPKLIEFRPSNNYCIANNDELCGLWKVSRAFFIEVSELAELPTVVGKAFSAAKLTSNSFTITWICVLNSILLMWELLGKHLLHLIAAHEKFNVSFGKRLFFANSYSQAELSGNNLAVAEIGAATLTRCLVLRILYMIKWINRQLFVPLRRLIDAAD